MKQITFRQLLNLMYEGKAPKQVKYNGEVYKKYKFYDYRNENRLLLSTAILNSFTLDLMNHNKCITICDEILDDKEKEYLSNIIKPFKKYVKCIVKVNKEGQEKIQIQYKDYLDKKRDTDILQNYTFFGLPTFKAGTMYRGMELNKEYTLEELGL